MIADCHMHTEFSYDCEAPVQDQIDQAVRMGLPYICFTDHYDMDFPDGTFQLDTPAYMERVMQVIEENKGRIEIGFGVELGMQTHLTERIREYTHSYPFDFVIGSMHLLEGMDPYDGEVYKIYGDDEAFRRYFVSTAENLKLGMDVDTLGHMDYIVRYGDASRYSYRKYADEIDTILKILIQTGRALEVNTGGMRKMPYPNPHPDVLCRYRELGGELITTGADAHFPQHIAYKFDYVEELLKSCGFSYYTVYKQRKPVFIKI